MILLQLSELQNGKLPYPIFVDDDGRFIELGYQKTVIGFAQELDEQRIDLMWKFAAENPALASGMFLVASDRGLFETYTTPVRKLEVLPDEAL